MSSFLHKLSSPRKRGSIEQWIPASAGMTEKFGKKIILSLEEFGRMSFLARDFLYWTFVAPVRGKRSLRRSAFAEQLVFMGNESLTIVILVTVSVGAVLALQAAYQLNQFGAVMYTGALVSVSMARELGPLVTAIIIAGRVGASITAQLGTMKVSEEVDALITMGIPPVPFLVVPRILAMLIMLPALTILSFALGILGGLLIGVFGLGLDGISFLKESLDALVVKDILTGTAKGFIFALLVSLIATYKGLNVKGGAEGVGKATTESVVYSIIAIIVSDALATAVFYYAFP